MLYFLEAFQEVKKIIPTREVIKEQLIERENKFNQYADRFMVNVVEYTPRIISAFILLLVGLWLISRIAVIAEKAMQRRELEVSLRTFLRSLMSIGLKIILVVTVAGMIGIGTTSFVTILGAAGLAIGLALQGSLSNFAGGVLILIFKPFKVGDSIEAAGQSGQVTEIQIFNTVLLTGEHKTVILPNGPLSNGTIINTTKHGDLRVDLEFRISNENDLGHVKNIVRSTISQNEKIIKGKETAVLIGKFSEGLVLVHVKPYCLPGDTGTLVSELYESVKLAFENNNIKLAATK